MFETNRFPRIYLRNLSIIRFPLRKVRRSALCLCQIKLLHFPRTFRELHANTFGESRIGQSQALRTLLDKMRLVFDPYRRMRRRAFHRHQAGDLPNQLQVKLPLLVYLPE